MDRSRGIQKLVLAELEPTDIVQPKHLSPGIPKHRNRQVDAAIPVKVTALNVSHPSDIVQNDMSAELAVMVLEKFYPPNDAIVGHDVSQYRNQDVEVAIVVDVDDRQVCRRHHVGYQHRLSP